MSTVALCVYCEELPQADRGQAARIMRCPLCKAEIGVGSSGTRFRLAEASTKSRHSRRPALITALAFIVACTIAALGYFILHRDNTIAAPMLPPYLAPAAIELAPLPQEHDEAKSARAEPIAQPESARAKPYLSRLYRVVAKPSTYPK